MNGCLLQIDHISYSEKNIDIYWLRSHDCITQNMSPCLRELLTNILLLLDNRLSRKRQIENQKCGIFFLIILEYAAIGTL